MFNSWTNLVFPVIFFDDRWKDYKNTQLISQFTSPYTGKLISRNRTGLSIAQYEKLKAAHAIASELFLIGPSKDPIFLTDRNILPDVPKQSTVGYAG